MVMTKSFKKIKKPLAKKKECTFEQNDANFQNRVPAKSTFLPYQFCLLENMEKKKFFLD